ncbi:signal peptidase I [Streptomyces radicis]|uniref:Signal peptidase I n=1 Tax=Streptomyces radicis TaxID=1750517 RepID=A0A3A9W2T9_9ACTN|nr:signal peptidase I [Streptomyces radicis]RKN19369.1 signal peptidase I [Streptomyces radicis]
MPGDAAAREAEGDPGRDPDDRAGPGPEPSDAASDDGAELAADARGGRRGRRLKREVKQRSFWKELPILIGIAIVLALVIKTFLMQAFSIPSNSMQNTLQEGDRVLVDKLTPWFGSEPERGEVVVFHDPGGWLGEAPEGGGGLGGAVQSALSFIGLMPSAEDQDLIKRVIAVGGDTVACEEGGEVQVNGEPLDESEYLFPGNTPCGDRPFGPIEIPEGRLWVMGDHRQDSLDSRYHQNLEGGGTVSEDDVVGRAIVIAWPIDRWGTLPVPDSYGSVGAAAMAATPAALGVAGAVPLVLMRRRRLLRKAAEAAPVAGEPAPWAAGRAPEAGPEARPEMGETPQR